MDTGSRRIYDNDTKKQQLKCAEFVTGSYNCDTMYYVQWECAEEGITQCKHCPNIETRYDIVTLICTTGNQPSQTAK